MANIYYPFYFEILRENFIQINRQQKFACFSFSNDLEQYFHMIYCGHERINSPNKPTVLYKSRQGLQYVLEYEATNLKTFLTTSQTIYTRGAAVVMSG